MPSYTSGRLCTGTTLVYGGKPLGIAMETQGHYSFVKCFSASCSPTESPVKLEACR
jgi:hypothetical protein